MSEILLDVFYSRSRYGSVDHDVQSTDVVPLVERSERSIIIPIMYSYTTNATMSSAHGKRCDDATRVPGYVCTYRYSISV